MCTRKISRYMSPYIRICQEHNQWTRREELLSSRFLQLYKLTGTNTTSASSADWSMAFEDSGVPHSTITPVTSAEHRIEARRIAAAYMPFPLTTGPRHSNETRRTFITLSHAYPSTMKSGSRPFYSMLQPHRSLYAKNLEHFVTQLSLASGT